MATITQVTDTTSFYWQALMLQLLQCYLSRLQVYTCTTKLLKIATAFSWVCSSCLAYINYCLALPNSIFDGFSDFKFSTQLVSTVVVAAITVFQVRFEFLAASRIRSYLYAILRLTNNELLLLLSIIIMYSICLSVQAQRPGNSRDFKIQRRDGDKNVA